jgi:hypothetical protein
MRYLILLTLFTGCYSAKKAEKQTNKALLNYPEKVANIARNAFPCITTATDTIVTTQFEFVEVQCPDSIIKTENIFIKGDTITKVITKPVRIQVPTKTIYVNTFIEDSAKIKLYSFQIMGMNKTIGEQYEQIVKKDKKITAKNKELWIHRSLWFLLCMYIAYRLYRNITTIKFKA